MSNDAKRFVELMLNTGGEPDWSPQTVAGNIDPEQHLAMKEINSRPLAFDPETTSQTIESQLTDSQKQTYRRVLSLIGEDAKVGVNILATGSREQALKMLRESLNVYQKTALKRVIEMTVPSMEWHEDVRGDKYQAVSLEQTLEDLASALTEE